MSSSERSWLAPLAAAHAEPWRVAERWRQGGGRVVGVVGRLVPRELVLAAGMLPIRLSAYRLIASGEPVAELPDGLAEELSPETSRLLALLLAGRLDWIDALIIGRDTEAYTKLFYVLRELADEPERALPPFAFHDLLRQPLRTSARYNRLRARELLAQVSDWAGAQVSDGDLGAAVAQERALAGSLRQLDERRRRGLISGEEALIAAAGVQSLPADEALTALAQLPALDAIAEPRSRRRLWLTGSAQEDTWVYQRLEAHGDLIVGEDHSWGDDGREYPALTPDPLDGIVDRLHHSRRGSARAGLDRVDAVADMIAAAGAEAVLQLTFEHDEASAWELPRLRSRLGEIPVLQASIAYGARDERVLTDALAEVAGA